MKKIGKLLFLGLTAYGVSKVVKEYQKTDTSLPSKDRVKSMIPDKEFLQKNYETIKEKVEKTISEIKASQEQKDEETEESGDDEKDDDFFTEFDKDIADEFEPICEDEEEDSQEELFKPLKDVLSGQMNFDTEEEILSDPEPASIESKESSEKASKKVDSIIKEETFFNDEKIAEEPAEEEFIIEDLDEEIVEEEKKDKVFYI